MMKFSFCSLVVVIFVLPSIASSSDLPKDLKDPVLFCEGCYGTMYELDNMMISLKNLKLDQRIQSALEKVCHTDNLRKYVFSPPKMSKVSLQYYTNQILSNKYLLYKDRTGSFTNSNMSCTYIYIYDT